jgi:signal transduction histidine kinase
MNLLRPIKILILICSAIGTFAQQDGIKSWADAKASHQATLPVYWFESRPFISINDQGQLAGIEYDLILGFAAFVKQQYAVDVKIQWIEAESFQNTFDRVQQSTTPCLGASAFSITPERKALLDFSPPYMADIMVMISNKNVPMMESAEDFYRTFTRLKAITIQGTTYEKDLLELKQNLELGFSIEYISSAQNILTSVGEKPNSFGFIDLPIYMMYFSANPSVSVRRQNYYPVKREGYGLLMPKNTDWAEPMQAYIKSPGFQAELEKIMPRYLDLQLYRFVEDLSLKSNSNVELLNKENEIQNQDIQDKVKQLEKRTRANYFLTALVVVSTTFLVIIILLYRRRAEHKDKIEAQRKKIEFKNQQLEQRNQELVALNEEKNNLIKILAHDMRTPLNQVQGLSQILLFSNQHLPEDQKSLIHNIQDGASRLSKMISNILDVDALEGDRINVLTENISISPLTEKVMESFRKAADTKNITLNLFSDKPDRKISTDTLYLTQILENLISNAIKFSPLGKRVEISITGIQEKVRISVKDQGPGLTEQDQANLFKKFQRLSNRPTHGESSIGLGLAIVKRYTEMMGGRVWCESEPGMGAAFNLEFDEVV